MTMVLRMTRSFRIQAVLATLKGFPSASSRWLKRRRTGLQRRAGKALGWYSCDVPTGGGDGTEVIIDMLRQTHRHLAPGGKLYFPVAVGLSDDDKIMTAARQCFDSLVRKVDVWFPLSDEEYEIVSCCLPPALLERIQKKGSRMAWNGQIYEATEPKV